MRGTEHATHTESQPDPEVGEGHGVNFHKEPFHSLLVKS